MEQKEIEDYVELNGEKIYFYIQRKKIKNINLRVHKDKKVTISIPMRMPIERAKEFVKSKISWIKKQQSFYESYIEQKENESIENGGLIYLLGKAYEVCIIKDTKNSINIIDEIMEIHIKEKYIGNPEYIKRAYDKCLKEYALEVLKVVTMKYQQLMKPYGIPLPEIEIRQMKAVWGVCTPKKNKITYNVNLIKKPLYAVEYVVAHELAHFKHPNHSKNFYNFVSNFMLDWKDRKRELR